MSTSYWSPQIDFFFFPENKEFSLKPRNCFIRKTICVEKDGLRYPVIYDVQVWYKTFMFIFC